MDYRIFQSGTSKVEACVRSMNLSVKKVLPLEIEDKKEKASKERILENLIKREGYVLFLNAWWLWKDYPNTFKENTN